MPNIWYINPTETYNASGNGTSWAQARQRFNDATPSNYVGIKAGDTIRVAKSPDPYSIGLATWTDRGLTVTLESARTKNVDLCDSGWQAVSGECTLTHVTTRRQGSNAVKLEKTSAFNASRKIAYKTLSSAQDFSAYQCLNLWIRNSVALTNNMWIICLCSDTAGNTIVDSFPLCNGETTTGEGSKNPAIPSTDRFVPLVIKKSGGGNLGSAIQSVAIYSGSSPMGAGNIHIDNIFASKTDDLNAQSLISPQGLAQGNTEQWYCIKSINGTDIEIDGVFSNTLQSSPGEGYGFISLTSTNYANPVATYARETIKPSGDILIAATSTTYVQRFVSYTTLPDSRMSYEGGYNMTTDLQDGETFLDGLNTFGYGIVTNTSKYEINHINLVRYNTGIFGADISSDLCIKNIRICCSNAGCNSNQIFFKSGYMQCVNNCYYGYQISGIANGTIYAIGNAVGLSNRLTQVTINKLVAKGNDSAIYNVSGGPININHVDSSYSVSRIFRWPGVMTLNKLSSVSDASIITYNSTYFNVQAVCVSDYNDSGPRIWANGLVGQLQSVVADSGKAWEFAISATRADSNMPYRIPFGKLLLKADKNYTLSLKMRHSSTDVKAKFVVKANAAVGLMSDIESELLDTDTIDTWVTKTLTLSGSNRLTSDGVVEIELWFWSNSSSTAYLYADSLGVA